MLNTRKCVCFSNTLYIFVKANYKVRNNGKDDIGYSATRRR